MVTDRLQNGWMDGLKSCYYALKFLSRLRRKGVMCVEIVLILHVWPEQKQNRHRVRKSQGEKSLKFIFLIRHSFEGKLNFLLLAYSYNS
jgi:hypothetical protein